MRSKTVIAARLFFAGGVVAFTCQPSTAVETSKTAPPSDKYAITDEERAACSADAVTFCSGTYPDEDKLLVCMKLNRANLSEGCRLAFDRGVRRRHL